MPMVFELTFCHLVVNVILQRYHRTLFRLSAILITGKKRNWIMYLFFFLYYYLNLVKIINSLFTRLICFDCYFLAVSFIKNLVWKQFSFFFRFQISVLLIELEYQNFSKINDRIKSNSVAHNIVLLFSFLFRCCRLSKSLYH